MFMSRSAARLFTAALATALLSGTAARAESIHWSADWSVQPFVIPASHHGTGGVFPIPGRPQQPTGSADMVAAYLWTFTAATQAHPDHLIDARYTVTVRLTDADSHRSGSLSFTGVLNGTLWATQHLHNGHVILGAADITNVFTGPRSQTLHLGHHLYTVTLASFTRPTVSATAQTPGIINASVFVRHNPEPGGLVLLSIGASLVGLAARRKRARPGVSPTAEPSAR
jgi:hypothetical protein